MRKFLYAVLAAIGCLTLSGEEIKLSNGNMKITVSPENGGKITAIDNGKISFVAPPNLAGDAVGDSLGFGKVRIWGDNGEYMTRPWRVVARTPHSVTLTIDKQNPPQYFLSITKTITIPPHGRHIALEITFKNTNPVASSAKIVPWLHHGFKPGEAATFFAGHTLGVDRQELNRKISIQQTLKNTGNWSAFLNASGGGLLLFSETRPELFYNYLSAKVASLEALYPEVSPVTPFTMRSILAPVSSLAPEEIAALKLPQALRPQPTYKHTPGSNVGVQSHFAVSGETRPLNLKFWKSCAYVAPEIALPLVFGVRKTHNGGESILELDMPQELVVENHTGNYWMMSMEDMEKLSDTSVTRDGKQFRRLRYRITARAMPAWNPSHYTVFVRSSVSSGSGNIYMRALFNGKETTAQQIPYEVISIPRAQLPRKFKFWMGVPWSMYRNYPDFANTMRYLGINGICFNYNVPNAKVSPEAVKKANAELHDAGFATAVMGAGFYALPRSAKYQAVDIDGKAAEVFDFTVREGNWIADRITTAARHMKLGYDVVISDEDAYFGGYRYSFSPRTCAIFRKFFTAKYPEMPYIEPLEIARNSEKYPKHHAIWIDFKCSQFAGILRDMISASRQKAPGGAQIGWCTIIGASDEAIKLDNLIDNREFCGFLDWTMPMAYHNLYRRMANYRDEIELFVKAAHGTRAKVAPTLTLGFWGENNPFPAEHSGFIILETALTGCDGVYLFPGFAGTDNLGVKYMAQALSLVAQCEDIISGSQLRPDAVKITKAHNAKLDLPVAIKPLVRVNGRNMLVYIADYSPYAVDVTLQFRLPFPCRLYSLGDNTMHGVVRDGDKRQFTLQNKWGKMALLRLESCDGANFPADFAPQVAPETSLPVRNGDKILFRDTFDGHSAGKNLDEKHPFVYSDGGTDGKCLYFRDYQGAWVLDKKFALPGGEAKLSFDYKSPRLILPGGGKNPIELLRGNLDGKRFFTLQYDGPSGKLSFCIHEAGKSWTTMLRSSRDRWPENIWQHITLQFGGRGVTVSVDDTPVISDAKPIKLKAIDRLQLGRPWCSFGRFDNLTLQ